MTTLSVQVNPAVWVKLPESVEPPTWAAAAAAEMLGSRQDGGDQELLVSLLEGLARLPREASVFLRFALVGDPAERTWLLDLKILGPGEAPTAEETRAQFPEVLEKHVEALLVGGRFPGVRVYDPVYVTDPELGALSPESRSDILVPSFDYRFAVPHPEGGTWVVEATFSHLLPEELVAAFGLVDELLSTVTLTR